MDYFTILMGSYIAGMVLMLNGAVQLAVRNKTGPWKEGGQFRNWYHCCGSVDRFAGGVNIGTCYSRLINKQ